MKIIKPEHEVVTEKDILKKIELASRLCYKSEDKTCEGSDKKLITSLINRGHESVLEHGIIYIRSGYQSNFYGIVSNLSTPILKYFNITKGMDFIVSGNVRAWRDFFRHNSFPGWLHAFQKEYPILFEDLSGFNNYYPVDFEFITEDDIDMLSAPELLKHKHWSIKFICDRAVTHELVRHRPISHSQESTRYCNYGRDKFDNQISIILPEWFESKGQYYRDNMNPQEYEWMRLMEIMESVYMYLIDSGWSAQQARSVLPNALKTEIMTTANLQEWLHICKLRTSNAAHPQIREIIDPVKKMIEENYPEVFREYYDK
jgi:thymidylate synthase (FAD)